MKPADVNAGDIFRVTMNRANGITPPKGDESRDKFFVVLGFDDDGNVYGGVIFNSLMNLNLPPIHSDHAIRNKERFLRFPCA